MSNPSSGAPPVRPGRAAASLIAFLAVTIAVLFTPDVAAATERGDAVTDVRITHGASPVLYNAFEVHVEWTAPDDVEPGDTFTVTWAPDPAFQFFSATIDLVDEEGTSFGTCDVDATRMECTFGANVARFEDVSGTAWFSASFARSQGPSTLTFEVPKGTTFTVSTPTVGVRPEVTMPTRPEKWGWFNSTREHIVWEVTIPAARLASDGEDVVVTDEFGDNMTLVPSSLRVGWMSAEDYPAHAETSSAWTPLSVGSGTGTYAFTNRPDDHAFDVTINDPVVDDGRAYRIRYNTTIPPGVTNGDTFDNVVRGLAGGVIRDELVFQHAGGGANGQPTTTTTTSSTTSSTSTTTSPTTTAPTTTSTVPASTTSTTATPGTVLDSSNSTGGINTGRGAGGAGSAQSVRGRSLALTGSSMALALLGASLIAIGIGLASTRRMTHTDAD